MNYYKPYIKNKPKANQQWPIGKYGFVKTIAGCPEGFYSWRRTQDTENKVPPSSAYDYDWAKYLKG